MAVNPLIPYSDLVSGPQSAPSGASPVGITSAASGDPALLPGMSPAMAALWSNDTIAEGNFSGTDATDADEAEDDERPGGSQHDDHRGVPLPLPPLPGAPYPTPGSTWRSAVAPDNRPKIDPDNRGGVHEFTTEGHLTPEQEKQRRMAMADDRQIDRTNAEIAALREETSRPLPSDPRKDDTRRDGVIEPNWLPEDEDDGNFLTRYVRRLRKAWADNDAEYERRMSPEGKLAPPMSPKPLQDYDAAPATQRPEAVPAPVPEYGRPVPASMTPRFVSDDPRMTRKILERAHDMVGMPHKWGGDSFRGADDIGLARAAYRAGGRELPVTLDADNLPGERAKLSDLRPGDLVTWHDEADPSGNTRVGIVADKGRFITSSMRRGVSVRNLSELEGKTVTGRRVPHEPEKDNAVTLAEPTITEKLIQREVERREKDKKKDSRSSNGKGARGTRKSSGRHRPSSRGGSSGGSSRNGSRGSNSWGSKGDSQTNHKTHAGSIGATK